MRRKLCICTLTCVRPYRITLQKNAVSLGKGTFGLCALKMYRNVSVCVKYCKDTQYNDVITEASTTSTLQGHPNLPLVLGISPKSEIPPFIVTKFHGEEGNMNNYVRSTLHDLLDNSTKRTLSTKELYSMAMDCTRVLIHIHNQGFLHNDIKANNIAVDQIGPHLSASHH